MDTLYHQLHKIGAQNKISFHMPGTKGGLAMPPAYFRDVFKIDFTELASTDNLYAPEGILRQAQEEVARIYGAQQSFFLVNGATGGILAAFGYLSQNNKKILVDRNCHLSAVNAIGLFGARPVFVLPEYKKEWGHMGCVGSREVENALKKDGEIGAVFITSPNYFGWTADVTEISRVCRKYGVLLCVDAAHGAHFPFSAKLPASPVEAGADIVVMSMHKTLPAPTQTAVMHISERVDAAGMKRWINLMQTTSPSYIFMAYIHLAASYMEQNGAAIYDGLHTQIQALSQAVPLIEGGAGRDFTRVVIHAAALGGTGYALADFLDEHHSIETEMADLFSVVCIAGPGNTDRHFALLAEGCGQFKGMLQCAEKPFLPSPPFAAEEYNAADYLRMPRRTCPVENCAGHRAAAGISVYPPGVMLVLPGERISQTALEYISTVTACGGKVLGIENGQVEILDA